MFFSSLIALFVVPSPGPALQSPGLGRCRLEGSCFSRDGKRFLPVGAHWVPAKTGLQWSTSWNPADIEADFAKMQELGFNTVRLDLFWAWFEPRPGDYNPEAFKQLDYLVSLAHRCRIYLHPSLFIVGWVMELQPYATAIVEWKE